MDILGQIWTMILGFNFVEQAIAVTCDLCARVYNAGFLLLFQAGRYTLYSRSVPPGPGQ